MPTSNHLLCLFLFSFLIISCQWETEVSRAIYHWKVQPSFSVADTLLFQQQDIHRHYVRFFDVGWSDVQGPIPKGLLNRRRPSGQNKPHLGLLNEYVKHSTQREVIPVIYIENEVFKKIKETRIDDFVDKLVFKIDEIWGIEFGGQKMREIQLDCDWSETTGILYFGMIEELKKRYPQLKFSATIRLHQIKYANKTGVPPVDKGTLMYYNMGKIKDPTEPNSILNNNIGRQYINPQSSYPLELTLALPVYAWSVWFDEQQEFKGLFYSMDVPMVEDCTFLDKKDSSYYAVNQDTVYQHKYLRRGHRIRLERPTLPQLAEAKEICRPLLNKRKTEMILFSYAPNNSELLDMTSLNEIYTFK